MLPGKGRGKGQGPKKGQPHLGSAGPQVPGQHTSVSVEMAAVSPHPGVGWTGNPLALSHSRAAAVAHMRAATGTGTGTGTSGSAQVCSVRWLTHTVLPPTTIACFRVGRRVARAVCWCWCSLRLMKHSGYASPPPPSLVCDVWMFFIFLVPLELSRSPPPGVNSGTQASLEM